MGWSLELFLKQFVFLDWITKEQAEHIKENMNAPMCSLLVKLDHKITCDENNIIDLEQSLTLKDARIAEMEKERDGIRSSYEKLSEAFDDLNVQNNFHASKMVEYGKRIAGLEKELELKNSWVKHHRECVEITRAESAKLKQVVMELADDLGFQCSCETFPNTCTACKALAKHKSIIEEVRGRE